MVGKTLCRNGRLPISRDVERELFARAAGHCQRPACRQDLFIVVGDKSVSVGEMAHIIAATSDGPRGRTALPVAARSRIENLLLLCSTCHTLIDKAPDDFPVGMLENWKREHETSIRSHIGVVEYGSRAEARDELSRLLAKNRAVFEAYGPEAPGATDPNSETVKSWKRKVLEIILPTNRRVLLLLDANRRWLRDDEVATVETFRQHVDDVEARHLHGAVETAAQRFPTKMNDVFR